MTRRRSITTNICTCWISLVLLVINDAVEKSSNSLLEKIITLVAILFRKSLLKLVAILLDSNVLTIVINIAKSDRPNIFKPAMMM